MAFNLQGIGRRVATITGNVSKQFSNKIIAIHKDDQEDDVDKTFTRLDLPDDMKFQQVPNTSTEREVLYVTGASGSGKSTYIYRYCSLYKKKYPNRPIYLFSYLKEDESIDKLKPLRINIGENLLTDPIQCEDLKESIVIFDDTDCIPEKKYREAVLKILNTCLETGRHQKCTVLVSNHLPTDKNTTRRTLNESQYVTFFPGSALSRATTYMLTDYCGLDSHLIKKLKKMKTRWCTLSRNYPQFYMTEHTINMLANEED